MAYDKTVWKNDPDHTSPINADNLNHMEQGIYDAHKANSDLEDVIGYEPITMTRGYYITTNTTTTDYTHVSSNSYMNAVVDCAEGQKFTINGTGANAARLWAFADASGNILSRSGNNASGPAYITAPANASKLIINSSYSSSIGPSFPYWTPYTQKNDARALQTETAVRELQAKMSVLPANIGTLPDGTDLNTFFTPGWWELNSNYTYTNLPSNPITPITILKVEEKSSTFFIQTLTSKASGGSTTDADLSGYKRTVRSDRTSQAAWEYGYYFSEEIYANILMPKGELPNGTNLATFFTPGIWELNSSYTYTDLPSETVTPYSLLYVMKKYGTFEYQVLTNKTSGASTDSRDLASYQRTVRTDRTSQAAWKYSYFTGDLKKEIDVVKDNTQKDTSGLVKSYTHTNYNSREYNPLTAIRLKVGTINIGHYNYGAGDYYGLNDSIYDAKLHNWRKYFGSNKIDILNVNEWVPYIDYLASGSYNTGSKLATSYIYKPLYKHYDGDIDTTMIKAALLSKYSMTTPVHQALEGITGNTYASCSYSQITIDESHTVGVYGVQLSWRRSSGADPTGEEAILNRKAEMDSLTAFIQTHSDTYIVVMGDFNTPTATDHQNLLAMCTANNLIPCNGGWLDWEQTHENGYCLDNILVSDNIIVEDFNSQNEWYDAISTDHYGINAELILT